MSGYPEHDKLMRLQGGGHHWRFPRLLESKGIVLATRDDFGDLRGLGAGRWAALIGEYLEVDPEKLEMEKRAMIDKLRGVPL
jgi:hypothetical protein